MVQLPKFLDPLATNFLEHSLSHRPLVERVLCLLSHSLVHVLSHQLWLFVDWEFKVCFDPADEVFGLQVDVLGG